MLLLLLLLLLSVKLVKLILLLLVLLLLIIVQKFIINSLSGDDPGINNQKTPTILLLDPQRRFHSFGFTARDFYHDLKEQEARRWYLLERFKMILHHNKVRVNAVANSGPWG